MQLGSRGSWEMTSTLVKWMEVFNGVCACAYAGHSIVGPRTICTHWRLKY